jgi:hypothetical protein
MSVQFVSTGLGLPVVEVRHAQLRPGCLAQALAHLQSELGPAHVVAGSRLLGTFVTGDDRLLWLRGFAGLPERRAALSRLGHRGLGAQLAAPEDVQLMRVVRPEEGIRPIDVVRLMQEPLVAVASELRFAEQIGSYHLWLRLLLRKSGLDPIVSFATLAADPAPGSGIRRNRTEHLALLPAGLPLPALPPELDGMLRTRPEVIDLSPARAARWLAAG